MTQPETLAEKIFRIDPQDCDRKQLVDAHNTLYPDKVVDDYPAFLKRISQIDELYKILKQEQGDKLFESPEGHEAGEAITVLQTLESIFQSDGPTRHHPNKLPWTSVLSSWPFYAMMVERFLKVEHPVLKDGNTPEHLQEQLGKTATNALLIGCLHPLSARTFSVMAESMLGITNPADQHIIDIFASESSRQHANFQQANALSMPYEQDSIDIAFTSQLFYMLQAAMPRNEAVEKVITEMSRVVKPGGHIVLRELIVDWSRDDRGGAKDSVASESGQERLRRSIKLISEALQHAGFKDISVVEEVYDPQSAQFLFDKTPDFSPSKLQQVPLALGFYARLPN